MAGSVVRIPSPAAANCSRLCNRPVHLCRIGALKSSSISNCMRLISCTPNLQQTQRRKSSCCLSVSSTAAAAQVSLGKSRVPLKDCRNIGIMSYIESSADAQILYSKICEHEQVRGIAINSCIIPSHVDEVDGAVWLFDSVAAGGDNTQQPKSEAIWRQADEYGIPRLCFINNMDRIGANFIQTKDMIETKLFAEPLVLQLPIWAEENFKGVIDLVKMKAIIWSSGEEMGANFTYQDIPRDLVESAEKHREILIEAIVDMHYGSMEVYNGYFDEATIKELIRLETISCTSVPVLCGSVFNNKGVQLLLDAVVDYLPSPIDFNNYKLLNW